LGRLFVPFNGSETTADTSAVDCENLYERFLAGLNTVAHVRASAVQGAEWYAVASGKRGTAVDVLFSLRFTVYDKQLATAKPTSSAIASVSAANPAGVVVASMVPGD
jgi:hypothetical protein